MAEYYVYYDDYDDYDYEPTFYDTSDTTDIVDDPYDDETYDTAQVDGYEAYGDAGSADMLSYSDSVASMTCDTHEGQREELGGYEEDEWEEDNRYAPPYNSDSDPTIGEGEVAYEPGDFGELLTDAPYASYAAETTVQIAEGDELSPDDEEAAAWAAAWVQGPLVGEDELAWADAMDDWRQQIEAARTMDLEEYQEPLCNEANPQDVGDLDEPPLSAHWMLSELEQLQASYDEGEVPENEREEYARVLADLWACELEDQRVRAEGYVWNEELGEYLYPHDTDPPFDEEDIVHPLSTREDIDVDAQEHLADVSRTFWDVNPLLIAAVYPPFVPHTPRGSYQMLPTTRAQTTYAHPPKTLSAKKEGMAYRSSSAVRPFKTTNSNRRASRKRQRDSPPHLPASRTSAPERVAAKAPPPPGAPESLREATKISLVDLAAHLPIQPTLPEPKTAASVTAQPVNVPSNTDDKTLSDDGHLPDASTKDAPPALPGAGAASSLSQCHPTVDTVVLPRLPKPPNICSLHAGPVDLQDLAGMVQRRRNALRRISKKEKV
ncbi:hypothetical protein C8J57DRAFT_1343416 [Mycena rebaudengoi]|nr:hypothetical protein C8J57DRAFT_1343416 [Mycena rebaudengoi]